MRARPLVLGAFTIASCAAPAPDRSAPTVEIVAVPSAPAADPPPSATTSASAPAAPDAEARALERACEASGDMDACMRTAYAYEGGSGLPRDPARAVALFQQLCDEEAGIFPQPCQSLASHLLSGDGVAKDAARAARIHAATCSQGVCDVDVLDSLCADKDGDAEGNVGCVALASIHTMPVAGAPYNPSRAKALLERACRRRDAAACRELAAWYADGRAWPDGSVPKDPKRAAKLMKQACDAGDAEACAAR